MFAPELKALQFGPEERGRAIESFEGEQAAGLKEILGGIQADVQRAGLGGTGVGSFQSSLARQGALRNRMAFGVQLDQLARELAQQRFQNIMGIGEFSAGVAAPAITPRAQQTVGRTPSTLGTVSQAMTGVGGQMLGAWAGAPRTSKA